MRVGVLGGTFDPVHEGHLRLALAAREELNLDRFVFVPNARNPLKGSPHLTPRQRLALLRRAARRVPGSEVSDIEMRRGGASYTVDTLRLLKRRFGPSATLYFVTGADACSGFARWRSFPEVLRLARLVVGSRPGYRPADLPQGALRLVFDAADISATSIRQGIGPGRGRGEASAGRKAQGGSRSTLMKRSS